VRTLLQPAGGGPSGRWPRGLVAPLRPARRPRTGLPRSRLRPRSEREAAGNVSGSCSSQACVSSRDATRLLLATSRSHWGRTADTCFAVAAVLSDGGGDAAAIVPRPKPGRSLRPLLHCVEAPVGRPPASASEPRHIQGRRRGRLARSLCLIAVMGAAGTGPSVVFRRCMASSRVGQQPSQLADSGDRGLVVACARNHVERRAASLDVRAQELCDFLRPPVGRVALEGLEWRLVEACIPAASGSRAASRVAPKPHQTLIA
jgi:hypothetical protein